MVILTTGKSFSSDRFFVMFIEEGEALVDPVEAGAWVAAGDGVGVDEGFGVGVFEARGFTVA